MLPDPVAGARECLRVTRKGDIFAFTTDVSLDNSRELRQEKLKEIVDFLKNGRSRFLSAGIGSRKKCSYRTDGLEINEPSALPWASKRRSLKERANNLLSGKLSGIARPKIRVSIAWPLQDMRY